VSASAAAQTSAGTPANTASPTSTVLQTSATRQTSATLQTNSSAGGAQPKQPQADDPAKKLGAYVGKWETEGAFAGGPKISTSLECRWSPQGVYLVCDQLVRMGGGDHHQFTVYSYNSKDGYSYTTLNDPGAKPSSGGIVIAGNLWTYDSSFEANGKKTMVRTTNEFTDAKTEVFKVATSDDGGAHWKPVLEGTAHKTGD
jgi:hypothetical protein